MRVIITGGTGMIGTSPGRRPGRLRLRGRCAEPQPGAGSGPAHRRAGGEVGRLDGRGLGPAGRKRVAIVNLAGENLAGAGFFSHSSVG